MAKHHGGIALPAFFKLVVFFRNAGVASPCSSGHFLQ